jgi:hypothetical protein
MMKRTSERMTFLPDFVVVGIILEFLAARATWSPAASLKTSPIH